MEQVKGVGFLILLLLACYGAWGLVANIQPDSSHADDDLEFGAVAPGEELPISLGSREVLGVGSPPTFQASVPATDIGDESTVAPPGLGGSPFASPGLMIPESGDWNPPFGSPPMGVPDHVSSLPRESEMMIPVVVPADTGPRPGALASTTIQPTSEQDPSSLIGIPATVHDEMTIPNAAQGEVVFPPVETPDFVTPERSFDPMEIIPESVPDSVPEARLEVPELPPIHPMEIAPSPKSGLAWDGPVVPSPMPTPERIPLPSPVQVAPSMPPHGITPLPSVTPSAHMPNAGRVEAIHFGSNSGESTPPVVPAPSGPMVPPEGMVAISIPGVNGTSRVLELPPIPQAQVPAEPQFPVAPQFTVENQAALAPPVTGSSLPALPLDMIADAPFESLLRAGVEEVAPSLAASSEVVRPECARFLEEVNARLNHTESYAQQLVPMYEVLSAWYGSSHLTRAEKTLVTELLDQVTGTIVYSRESWLEEPYIVRAGDRLDLVARQYGVPWQLLAKVNQIRDPGVLPEGMPLKVLSGPFSAVVDLSEHELILRLDGKYAGRFEIGVGRTMADQTGTYKVRNKSRDVPFQHPELGLLPPEHPDNPVAGFRVDLGEGVCLHGTPRPEEDILNECPGYVCLRPEDMDHVIDILSEDSLIVVQR